MDNHNEENLRELLEKFFAEKDVEQAWEDIRNGERIIAEHNAPKPDEALLSDIKAQIGRALLRRTAFRHAIHKIVAVAAVFIFMTVIAVKLFEADHVSIIPTAVWDSNSLADDDVDLVILTAEIEQLDSEVLAVQLGENGGNENGESVELETELMEIDSTFWKG